MDLVTRASPNDNYLWWIYGTGDTEWFWSRFQAGGGFYESQWLNISHRPVIAPAEAGIIDLGGNNTFVDPRDADAVTFDIDGRHMILPRNVEYFDSSLATTTEIRWLEHFGGTTDGSLDVLFADVGNHDFDFTAAIKDSSLHLGAGWDQVDLIDHRDTPGDQYWALIRRADNSLDAYSLLTGSRIRMEDGLESRNGLAGKHNFGEVEILTLADSRNGGTPVYKPGEDLPSGRGTPTNIDLRSDGATHSDSFNLAYFNFIRYTSDNVWVGEATIHDGTDYSTPSDRRVAADKNIYLNSGYDYDAPVLSGQLSVLDQSRNGTHDLIVAEQATTIDGKVRLYTFNVASELYNEFNAVFLGSGSDDASDKSSIGGSDWSDRVALYGFGGEDVLKGGAGRDYIFGGQSVYNQLNAGETGNQVTGGTGADYFGVGNTNSLGAVTGANSTDGTPSTTGEFHQGYATDVIMDWRAQDAVTPHDQADTLVVLSNGVVVIAGLRDGSGTVSLESSNLIDLRDYAAVATSDQDFDGARGGDNWDDTENLDYIYANQATRDANSIANESDRTVVNNGLIVALGREGDDTVFGSAGNDYLYGNKGADLIALSEGGTDRVYFDTFDSSLVSSRTASVHVADFDGSGDQIFLNKSVIDAFNASGNSRDITTYGGSGSYAQATAYDPSINFLHDKFYSPSIYDTNENHRNNDGAGAFGDNSGSDRSSGWGGGDGTTFGIGAGMVAAGTALLFVPFMAGVGAGLIAGGTALGAGATFLTTNEHENATYTGNVSHYLNFITPAETGTRVFSTPSTDSSYNADQSVTFMDFFQGSNAGDGFVEVIEFTAQAGQGIYGYFALHAQGSDATSSDDETHIFLVASSDNLVEASEAIKVVELNGLLDGTDFKVYDGEGDIYNARTESAIILRTPSVTSVVDQNGDFGVQVPDDSADPNDNDALIEKGGTPDPNELEVVVQLNGERTTGSIIKIYDGRTLIFSGDENSNTENSSGLVSVSYDSVNKKFVVVDGRSIGTVAIDSQVDPVTYERVDPVVIDGVDNSFNLQDSVVNYSIELIDGTTGISTRANSGAITVSGGNNVIDGGTEVTSIGDILNIVGTVDYINTTADENIIEIETIILSAADTNGSGDDDTPADRDGADNIPAIDVGDDAPILDLSNQSDGFVIYGSSISDSIIGSQGNDTIVGGGGQDTISLASGGADRVSFAYSDAALGAENTYDIITGMTANDEIHVSPSGFADTNNSGQADDPVSGFDDRDGDATRLMYETATLGANKAVASATELLVVSNSSVASAGDITANIASALNSAFNLAGLDGSTPSATTGAGTDSSVLYAVLSDTGSYWVGRYEDVGNDDVIADATEIEVFANAQSSSILDSFWLDTVEVPSQLSIIMPSDTAPIEAAGATYYTQNLSVSVSGLTVGKQVAYSLDAGSTWTFNQVGDVNFDLSDNSSYGVGDIVVRAYDAAGFAAPSTGTLISSASLPDGNYSALSTANTRAVTTDNIAPSAPANAPDLAASDDDGTSNSDNITTQTSGLNFSGVVEANSLVEIYSASTLKATVTADSSGNYSADVALSLGRNQITVNSSDLAGNFSSASPALEVIVSYQDISSGASLGSPTGIVQVNNTSFGGVETIDNVVYVLDTLTTTDTVYHVSSWRYDTSGEVITSQQGLITVGDAYVTNVPPSGSSGSGVYELVSTSATEVSSAISGMTLDSAFSNASSFWYFEGYDGGRVDGNENNHGAVWYWQDSGDGVAQDNELTLVAERTDISDPQGNLQYVVDVL